MSNNSETSTLLSNTAIEGEVIYEAPVEPTKEEKEAALIAKRSESGYFGPGVSELGAERATADEIAATAAGFSVKPPIYEIDCHCR
jgi:hypothetical protein